MSFSIWHSERFDISLSEGDFHWWSNRPRKLPSRLNGNKPSISHESKIAGLRMVVDEWVYSPKDPEWQYLPPTLQSLPTCNVRYTELHNPGVYGVEWLALNCVALAIFCIKRPKPNGPALCKKCGYDLRAGHPKCPECGTPCEETLNRQNRMVDY